MPEIYIRDVTVDFPFEPYDIQKEYMSKVIECLQNKQNGVLESPTGTGKTLSLLCSSLAWLCAQTAAFQAREVAKGQGETNNFLTNIQGQLESQTGSSSSSWGGSLRPPKVVYASRTHSQLGQVMLELKKTSYRHLRVGLLGSRDQLCIHPEVSREPNITAKIHMCKTLLAEKKCVYHLDMEKKVNEMMLNEDRLVDMEDLLKKGKQSKCCPYYASREIQKTAQVLFTPYNYLLDPKTRKAQDISLLTDVIILDEGHNIEKVCEESASSQLNSTTVAICITEITSVMKTFSQEMEENILSIEKNVTRDFSAEELAILKTVFLELEKAIDELELPDKKSKTFPGSYIFKILGKAQINTYNRKTLIEKLDSVCQFLMTIDGSQMRQKGASLTKFSEFLEVVFNSLGIENSEECTDLNYKLHVEVETVKQLKGNSWSNTTPSSAVGKCLNFWCFNPGFGMKSLADQGVHSIILTSGTLSPLAATISEIGIPVSVQLSNQHIIKPDQICAVVVDKGPAGTELRCVYQNRTNEKYLADLGQTCLNFYRVIPGGVLVFFPSYPFLKLCVEFWQSNGTWDKMAAIKSIFIEPQNKDQMKSIMEDYYKMIDERGASLFAVCRGKISEGLDFADNRARAVIVIGLPYPPFNDPKVVLKREYLDNGKKKKVSSLDGNDWYQLEAMRAVNQAVGRVIRHASDHGAIIFCDCRFSFPSNIKTLSIWLQQHIIPNSTFGQGLRRISNFFKSWKDTPTRICYDDDSKPFASSYPKNVVKSDQKIFPLSSSGAVNYAKIYSQFSDNKEVKVEKKAEENKYEEVEIKRKSVLEALEQENNCCRDTTEAQEMNISNDCKPVASASHVSTCKVVKKRKLVITKPEFYDTKVVENEKQCDSNFSHQAFVLKFQQNSTTEQKNAFKEAIREYKNGGSNHKFLEKMAILLLKADNLILRTLFEDIHHYLKDEHKTHFWNFYNRNVNTYNR